MNSKSLFYFFYRRLVLPVLMIAFRLLALFLPKIRKGLDARKNRPWIALPERAQPTIWIHAASGEFEYAKPVITRLKKQRPDIRIVVTYFSPTFAKAVHAFPGVDFATPLPWDRPSSLQEFLLAQKPSVLLIARTDTWPEMLRQAKEFGLATLLFSATLPRNAGRVRSRLGRWMTRATFSYLDQIMCVDSEDRSSFSELGFGERTVVAGDTRYDQVMERLLNPKPLRDELFTGHSQERVFVCGSTWSEDEAVLIEALPKSKQIDFVLVPHEPTPEHLAELEAKIAAVGMPSVRYTTAVSWPQGSVLIVDKIGILAELYQKGRFAFVGGSFRKTVHSVMEPLGCGCLTLVGPLYKNNREAIEFQTIATSPDRTAVVEVLNAESLAAELARPVDAWTSEKTKRALRERAGKSDLVVSWALQRFP